MVRDDFRSDVAELVIDDERQYHRVLAYVRRTSPELAERVKLYKGKRPLFQRYEIEQGIRSTLPRRVPLPSGGSLVFDYAEAFTVVDVNTGRFTGTTKKLEDTILKNNLEAAVEVVRQLRLRDIGGIIVVDFIDMASQKNRDAVLEVLQRELEKDRTKVYVVEISPLGLVEMTRKNIADGVREIMTCDCPVCEGTGPRALRRVARDRHAAQPAAHRARVEERGLPRRARGRRRAHADRRRAAPGSTSSSSRRAARSTSSAASTCRATTSRCWPRARWPRSAPRRRRARPATSSTCRILEPHRFVETDAVSRLSAGYEVQVVGGLPYVGTTQRLRIERATRFAAQAALLDVEPARPVAPAPPRPTVEDVDGTSRGQGLRHPRARAPRRRAARRRGPRAPAEAPHGGRAAPREGPLGPASGRRRRGRRRARWRKKARRSPPTSGRRRRRRRGAPRRARARTARRRPAAPRAAAAAAAAGAAAAAARAHAARDGAGEVAPKRRRRPSPPRAGRGATSERRAGRVRPATARPRQRRRRSGSGGGGRRERQRRRTAPSERPRGAAERRAPAAPPSRAKAPPSAPRAPARARAASRARPEQPCGAPVTPRASEDERRKGLISRILGR